MTAAPIAFRSNPGKYQFLGTTELFNAYAEAQGQDAKGTLAVLPCEGLVEFCETDADAGPCRGMIYMEDLDAVYSIHPSSAYKLLSDGTCSRIGTIPGNDIVQLSRNQKADPEIVVRSDAMLQVIASDAITPITDSDLPDDAVTAEFVAKYHVYGFEDTTFYLSGINDALNVDGGDFDTFNQRAGKLVRIIENNGELVGLNSTWMEFWRNTGNADFPFDPIGFRTRGCKAGDAVVRCDNTLMFPGDDNNIYRLNGYDPQIISTNSVSELIQDDDDAAEMFGFSYDRRGHKFACFTGADWTRCYDAATGAWHNRESYGQTTWRGRFSVNAFGTTLFGDGLSGKIFTMSDSTFTEDDEHLIWKVISPPLHVFPNGAILDAVHFDLATGFGGLSTTPKVMLRTSTDGGNTFSNYRELSLGTPGNYQSRVTARRLGRFGPKGIVFELSISDDCARALVGCDVELRPLKR